MKIIVSQKEKKLEIIFKDKNLKKSFVVGKSDEFLECVDELPPRFSGAGKVWKNARLEFENTGLLTERIIRVIILGLSF